MRVALISINFSPEVTGIGPVVRAYADTLDEAGHDVVVITGFPHYPEWRPRPVDGTAVPYHLERCRHYVPRRSTTVRLALYELSFAYAVARRLGQVPRADVVVTVIPLLAAAAVAVGWAARTDAPSAVVVQDIVSAGARETAMVTPMVGGLLRWIEDTTLRRCTSVGVINETMIEAIATRGVDRARLHLVPNWPLRDDVPYPPRNVARAETDFPTDRIVAVHAGNMGAKQGLEVVVEAARLASAQNAPVRFLLIGDGNQRAALESRGRGLSTLEIWPLQSEENYRRAIAGADVLLLTQRSTVRDFAFPSKLTSYARARRPIVASVAPDSATGRTLSRTGAALLVPPADPAALLAGVLAAARDVVLEQALVAAAERYYRLELDPAVLRANFRTFVEGAAHATRRV